MTALCFIDTETDGLRPDRRVWEVALIREADGAFEEVAVQIGDIDLSDAEPKGLAIGGFYERHAYYRPPVAAAHDDRPMPFPEQQVAAAVERMTRGAHLIGVNPAFDAECLAAMLRRHRMVPAWHYHVIDLSAMAMGFLNGRDGPGTHRPPYRSDDLAAACGVDPASEEERHTALGDVRWAYRWWQAMTA